MTSKVDATLNMNEGGRQVDVRGPISQWDSDEDYALFTVVISQVHDDGTVVNAMGSSVRYAHGAAYWEATAKVTDPGKHLRPGAAKAYGVATIATTGDPEAYPWPNDVELIPAVVAAGTRG
jgi:hypothetical protein